jgi:hypothetical protein
MLMDLPATYADWGEYARFAASFKPRSRDDASELGNWALARCRRIGELPRTLEELRTCLWFEHERWRFHGRVPDAETMRYCAALVRAIRSFA